MYCPRLDHFVRLNVDGSVGRCGHMINPKGFETIDQLDSSEWLHGIKEKVNNNEWPSECERCKLSEETTRESIRTKSIERHKILHPLNNRYLVVGGVLDNVCNSACQTCNSKLSTKIGSLESKDYPRVDNYVRFWELPQDRILEVDVNGGEPTASKNYKKILAKLPPNTKILRMNTNGSRMIPELLDVLNSGIMAIVTLSLDGCGETHNYVRWPIKWDGYTKTVRKYLELRKRFPLLKLNTWTTVSCLNINNLPDIIRFTQQNGLDHAWAFLNAPDVLNVKYSNRYTKRAKQAFANSDIEQLQEISNTLATQEDNEEALQNFVQKQDALRGISIKDYKLS